MPSLWYYASRGGGGRSSFALLGNALTFRLRPTASLFGGRGFVRGPSGLLLVHRLLRSGLPLRRIDVFESRSDPRDPSTTLGGRAYALGLGVRGRSALRSVDEALWSAVKRRGYPCERFRLHLTPNINFKLRDRREGVEPSVLVYQADLCGALLDELDARGGADAAGGVGVDVRFDASVARVDLSSSTISVETDGEVRTEGPYDLVVGCDGANSVVRDALRTHSPPGTFSFERRKLLPGCFKVARFAAMPPLLDPEGVALLLPREKSSGITAFVEPTVGGGACVLFAGRLPDDDADAAATSTTDGDDDDGGLDDVDEATDLGSVLFPSPDATRKGGASLTDAEALVRLVADQFPLLEGTPGMDNAAQRLLSQRTSVADAVRCNTYSSSASCATAAAICGDAAHATGGVSGQGCNSALVDATVLADCLVQHYRPSSELSRDAIPAAKRAMLHACVSSYSLKAVPEGRALYDLSFGNDGRTLPLFRSVRAALSNAVDAIFGGRFGIGRKPLQILLASSSSPFVDIQRDREKYFVEAFPDDEALREELEGVYPPVDAAG